MRQKGFASVLVVLVLAIVSVIGFIFLKTSSRNYVIPIGISQNNNPSTTAVNDEQPNSSKVISSEIASSKVGVSFDIMLKSVAYKVLGVNTSETKRIPVQIFAFEDHNGNGVRKPDDHALFLMPVSIYDSPFSSAPISNINSTDSGWASALLDVAYPYQLVVVPSPTDKYIPTTKPMILSEKNNFAVVGFKEAQSQEFHTSIFSFNDVNKDGNFNYDDPNEKPLFLAPFKFYQESIDGEWKLLPNTVNSTDTGWCTTSNQVSYPYRVKVVAEDLNDLNPSNKEIIITNKDSTLVFPYISK